MTKAERAVLGMLADRADFQSAQEVHAALRATGSTVGLTSVYRALQRLRDADQLDEIRRSNGELAYRRCPSAHHHHLTCERCGMSVELQATATERWVQSVAREHGYLPTTHILEVSGICPACQV